MKKIKDDIEILSPKHQLNLFGYEDYFNYFIKLHQKAKLPNSILLSGPKGLGKSTFVYHFINFLLSKNEEYKYNIKDLTIDKNNSSYKFLIENTHPNFFLIENNNSEKEIKIEQLRNLLKFLNKSTYTQDLKIVMIDNVENLNVNSSNALLKALEEPTNNTFFFIIHNGSCNILDTVRSRCSEFKFFFNSFQKKKIFEKIIKQYKNDVNLDKVFDNYFFDTPGNLIKYFLELENSDTSILKSTLKCIFYFMDMYNNEKNPETLYFVSLFIDKFYNEQFLNKNINIHRCFLNHSIILKKINEMKKFNLDQKSTFILIKDVLTNETK